MSNLPATVSGCRVMAKPSSSVCNLDCEYCFYLEKEHLYPERKRNWRMSDDTLEEYIKQQIAAQDIDEVTFSWQGGEPTLLGLDFFRKAVELQKKHKKQSVVNNAFQTNGILINDEWCQFFKENNFLVGVSIDGPGNLHDKYRVNRSGKPTHAKVMEAITLLKKHGVDFNTLTVVNAANAKHPERVYEFLTQIGSTYLQFIPLVEQRANKPTEDGLTLIHPNLDQNYEVTEWSVSPADYGNFLSKIFDVWVRKDVGRVFVNMFESSFSAWCGEPTGLCVLSPTCGHNFALEANGDLYNCDHYVYPDHLIGNLHKQSLREMNNSEKAKAFGRDKHDKLTKQCKQCSFRFTCNGGCPKHRFITSKTGEPRHNYFCEGYEAFFKHSMPYMQTMRNLLSQGRPAVEIMLLLNHQKQQVQAQAVGRNDPCPCGSGKKYKKCCG